MVDHNLLQCKKLFLFDLDGTLYLGDRLFPGVRELLSAIRARGGQYRFLTNNSSRSVEAYVEKLTPPRAAWRPTSRSSHASAS